MNISHMLEAVKYLRWQGLVMRLNHHMVWMNGYVFQKWGYSHQILCMTTISHEYSNTTEHAKDTYLYFIWGEFYCYHQYDRLRYTNKPYCCHCSEAHSVNKCSTNHRSYTLSANLIINRFINSKLIVINVCNVQQSTRTSHYADMNMP